MRNKILNLFLFKWKYELSDLGGLPGLSIITLSEIDKYDERDLEEEMTGLKDKKKHKILIQNFKKMHQALKDEDIDKAYNSFLQIKNYVREYKVIAYFAWLIAREKENKSSAIDYDLLYNKLCRE